MPSLTKKHWITITIVYMVLLLLVSLKPAAETMGPPSGLKQAAHNFLHVPAYAILVFLLFNCRLPALRRFGGGPALRRFGGGGLTCFIIAVIYGALMEHLQSFSPGRLPSVLDIILNTLGAGGMVVWLRWKI